MLVLRYTGCGRLPVGIRGSAKLVDPRVNGNVRVSTARPGAARALWLLEKAVLGTGGQGTSLLAWGSPTSSLAGGPVSSQWEDDVQQPACVTFKLVVKVRKKQPAGSKLPLSSWT